jgi:predicted transcriptional regulator
MGQHVPNVTDAEWAVLQVLWERGPATARQLRDALYPKGGPSAHATIHKLLERLEGKGHVRRQRSEGALVFAAAIERDDLIGRQLEAVVEKMCGGSLQPLLTNLVRVKRLSAADLRELLDLFEDLHAKAKSKNERRP